MLCIMCRVLEDRKVYLVFLAEKDQGYDIMVFKYVSYNVLDICRGTLDSLGILAYKGHRDHLDNHS